MPISSFRASAHRLAASTVVAFVGAAGCSPPPEQATAPQAAAPQVATQPAAAPASGDPLWHYEGAEGPANWGTLSPKFAACGSGRAQSPVDIVNASPIATAAPLKTAFPRAELKISHHEHVADGINNGHTIQINYPGGDTLTIGRESYALVQYHFHNPSEHTVNGRRFPMEMHLVHKSAAGTLAVIGVFIEDGAHNAAFAPVWANLPKQKGQETHYPSVKVDVDALLPANSSSYRYDGSLTTPPCSEGVKWVVMTAPVQLSASQIQAFTALIRDNNRPVQPLNGRRIVLDTVKSGSN
jgi:carbonic anhydrase